MRILVVLLVVISLSATAQKSSGDAPSPGEEFTLYAPNAFTPNADGINDVWKVVVGGPELDLFEVSVFDRSGNQVYFSNDPTAVWAGDTKGGDFISSPMVFVYFIQCRILGQSEIKSYRGHITMVR